MRITYENFQTLIQRTQMNLNLMIIYIYNFLIDHNQMLYFFKNTFQLYAFIVTKCKHGIGTNYIITFNEELENTSTSIIELTNIGQCSHEDSILLSITKTDSKNQKQISYRG